VAKRSQERIRTVQPKKYDAIVIGTGQAGKPLAVALGQAGWKTAVIERSHVGGSCVNHGCTPTKTMVASARVAYLAKRGPDYGVSCGTQAVDLGRVIDRKREVVESFRGGVERSLEATENLDLIRGTGRFLGPREIEVNGVDDNLLRLKAEKIFINTCARPLIPPIEGLDRVPKLDSTSIMELRELPEHLLVIGGGYIGLEFGQMFCRFGSQVTILQKGRQLLTREDPDVAQELSKVLEEDGIDVSLNTEVTKVEGTEPGRIRLHARRAGQLVRVDGSHLLVAVGRAPESESLNLQAAGIETDEKGHIRVNERLQTNVPGVFALGDVKPGPAFTHISYDDFRILRTNLLEGGNATTEGRLVPYTVFTDPQLGRVGLSEEEARQEGYSFRVARLPMSNVARAIEMNETRGFIKVLVDPDSEQIRGCAVLGIEGGEIMAMLQIAMMGRVSYKKLKEGIFAHPTLAECLNNLFATI
jgi:pyruvate/2-oxoglutarate dehydrogenase complex dihydrolipoamide dehydrogenase (E3) component